MEKTRFDEIKKGLGASIRMNLETIRKNLHDNKAACFVGAGFSKNADMDEGTYMKDWSELGTEFYRSLYCEEPNSEDLKFKSVLRLASQVEAVKGRAALEALIQNALPNAHVFPGRLHVNLMQLPWNDVFTTNYDTLLEKSCIEADRYYYSVTNKETLLYTPHPRIIKLHGSFPDIRPFVITEEDFRTYPQRFPEFVNTVRQSLIENVLCLIGFSGDDPNFLSWLGWLRDVMGKQASPVYQITYDTKMHDSNIKLFYDLGIAVVNLAEIKGLQGYSDALDFLLQYLLEEYKSHWSGEIPSARSIRIGKTINIPLLTDEMLAVRESYPGWYLLPISHVDEFADIKESFPYYGSILDEAKLTKSELVSFLYEIDWRIDISGSSHDAAWFLDILEELPLVADDEITIGDYKKILSLKISLLSHYRTHLEYNKYVSLRDELQKKQMDFSYEQYRSYIYQCCLYEISLLNYAKVETLLDQWTLRSMDYVGVLWKSGIMQEIGRKHEAESLLKESFKTIKRNILGDAYSPLLICARSAIEFRIWYLDVQNEERPKANADFDFYGLLNHYRDEIKKIQERPDYVKTTHGFNLFSVGTQWNFSERGYSASYIYSYRYLKTYERIGVPFGDVNGVAMDIDAKGYVLAKLITNELSYPLSLVIRSGNYDLLKRIVVRDVIRYIDKAFAGQMYDKYISVCESCLNNETTEICRKRTFVGVLPLLTRLSTKLPNEYNKRLFGIWIEVYKKYPSYYEPTMLSILYDNTSGQEYLDCAQMAFECPIQHVEIRKDIVLPDRQMKQIVVTSRAVSIIIDALTNSSGFVLNNAYNRLHKIVSCQLLDEQRTSLNQAVVSWRASLPVTKQKVLSLFAVPSSEMETDLVESFKKSKLDAFLQMETSIVRSSQPIDDFADGMIELQPFFKSFSTQEHISFVEKIIRFLTEHEEQFKNDDSHELMGGFHARVSVIFDVLSYYTNMESLPVVESDVWDSLSQVMNKYRKYNYPVMQTLTHLSFLKKMDKTRLKNMIADSIFGENDALVKDSVSAYIYMTKKQGKRVNQSILKRVISSMTYTCNERTKSYFRLLFHVLLYGGVSTEAKGQLISFMDSYGGNLSSFSIDEELRSDIMYFANILAGEMSVLLPEWTGVVEWKEKMDTMFNDVKIGFEEGVKNASQIEQ